MPMNRSQLALAFRGRNRWLYWNSATNATSYKLVWGSATATYASSLSVGNVLKYKIQDLSLSTGGTYYLAVKAVGSGGSSSASSELVIRDNTQIG
jgi:hypothetical protein